MAPTDPTPRSLHDRQLEMAARRLVCAHEVDVAAESPASDDTEAARAVAAIAKAWDTVGELGSTPEMIALRRAALNNASLASRSRWFRRPLSSMSRWVGAAALLLVCVMTAGYLWSRTPQPQLYETQAGERRVITLADTSKVFLDENSRVEVTYSRRLRDLLLLQGQAEFDVAKDPTRPFSVSAGGRRVIATGTLFNVDLLEGQLLVSLLEGSVVVTPESAEAGAETIHLKPSERLIVERATGLSRKTSINATDIEAWKLGKLVFDVEPLASAVTRVNRYARHKITLAATDQADAPISGVFNVGDIHAFSEAVSTQLPIRVEAQDAGVVLVRK